MVEFECRMSYDAIDGAMAIDLSGSDFNITHFVNWNDIATLCAAHNATVEQFAHHSVRLAAHTETTRR